MPKKMITLYLPQDLAEEVRDAVVALSGPPELMNLTKMGENAYRRELDRLKRAHRNGKPFPPRQGELRRGFSPK